MSDEERAINIVRGRHPLLECVLDSQSFIANSLSLDAQSNVMLLSGPNAAGKSIYLAQTALIVYMAHIGSFVPASSAQLSLCDAIFTRIRSIDSMSSGSTFAVDSRQVASALAQGTSRSLVLVDEWGRGTDHLDAVALVSALLDHLSRDPK